MNQTTDAWNRREQSRGERTLTERRRLGLGRRAFTFALGAISAASLHDVAAGGGLSPPFTPQERALIMAALQSGDELTTLPAGSLSDDVLQASLVRHATAELGLRVRPSDIDSLWAIAPPPRQVEAEIVEARSTGGLNLWLQSLAPASASYRALRAARCRYRQIVDNGGWPQVIAARNLRPDGAGPAVQALRRRLAIEGYLADVPHGDHFDAELTAAVRAFQRGHDLEPDGVVGPETREALNVTAEQRLIQIEANLERRRWLRSLPADRVEVNVAAAEAALYVDGAAKLSMRAVVGDLRHQTPIFSSRLASILLNPPWNVPTSIAAKELWPKERAQPGYLKRNGFRVVDGALRQAPGPSNALGRIKFDFPSPFGVYLHDTPGRSAFALSNRALSHGCIRLEKPRDLAARLLAGQGWSPERIDAAIERGKTQRIQLEDRLPVYVVYWSVEPQADGSLQFHPDRYGWDAKLTTALARAAVAPAGGRPRADTDCATVNSLQPAP